MAPMDIRWITQMSINAAHDEEFLELLSKSGCKGVLIGFESLDRETLRSMKKNFNVMRGGYEVALRNLRRYDIRVYGTFVFGYQNDTPETFDRTVEFAIDQRLDIAAFNLQFLVENVGGQRDGFEAVTFVLIGRCPDHDLHLFSLG